MGIDKNFNYNFFNQTIFRGSLGLAVAIILGAFGAHFLKEKLNPENLQVFETGVKYQFYGCLGLLIMALIHKVSEINLRTPILLLSLGILIFCGTVYFLALRQFLGIEGFKWIGAITPLGGLCMVVSWVWVGILFFKES